MTLLSFIGLSERFNIYYTVTSRSLEPRTCICFGASIQDYKRLHILLAENLPILHSVIKLKIRCSHFPRSNFTKHTKQGNSAEAKKEFEEILLYEGLDAKTKALVSKQLGWLHETEEEFGTEVKARVSAVGQTPESESFDDPKQVIAQISKTVRRFQNFKNSPFVL